MIGAIPGVADVRSGPHPDDGLVEPQNSCGAAEAVVTEGEDPATGTWTVTIGPTLSQRPAATLGG